MDNRIVGVAVKQVVRNHDDRGFFAEIIKKGEESFKAVQQTSITVTRPGVIKAFHWHKKQWDVWFVAKGMARVVLHDLRRGSKTFQKTNIFIAGQDNPLVIAIPTGVAHGYQVLGTEDVLLFYHTSEAYNPKKPDEFRIPFDDPGIGFDWSIKNR